MKMKRFLSVVLAVIMVITIFPMSANAAPLYSNKIVNEGENYSDSNFDMQCWSSAGTFTNNGTVNITNGFNLTYQATFINNGTFTFTGSSSTFDVGTDACSFVNNGTATISGCYNLGLGTSFINNGTLFLNNISNANVSGVSNTGTIVCGENILPSTMQNLENKTTGTGKVMTQEEYDNNSGSTKGSKYKITYDLNGGNWKSTPDESIFSYTYDTNDTTPYYKIGFDAPFDTLNQNVVRPNYKLTGWSCDKNGDTEQPSLYLDIMMEWRADITLKAHWEPETYYIFYYLDGGTFPETVTEPEIKNRGTDSYTLFNVESETFTLPTPTKSGYDFEGWKLGEATETYSSVTIPKGTTGNRAYTAKWKAKGDTPYKVNVYYMDKDGQYGMTPDKSYNETGITNTQIEVPDSTYEKNGFTYDEAKSLNTGTISADGSLVLSLYYKRNQYDITFKSYDGTETLYTYKGYYGTPIVYGGSTPAITEEGYSYTFNGWAVEKKSAYAITNLGTVSGDKTYYAAFGKEARFYLINFEDTTGFLPLEKSTIKINKGEDFTINLYLANEKYYVGTNEWILTLKKLHIYNTTTNKGLVLGKDFTYSFEGYGKPVVLSIPNVTGDLNITFSAGYHDTHDFSKNYDTILRESTCIQEGKVLHYCYKCGKTEEAVTPINPSNHTNLVKIQEKFATNLVAGNIEYYYCEDCGKYFSDKAGTREINIADTILPKLTVSEKDYQIIDGAGSSYTQESDGGITIRGNGEYAKFISVKVDGNVIDESNYSVREGSTIITLKAAYLNTLSVGTHAIEIVWTDGSAITNFIIKEKSADNAKTLENTAVTAPKTGDGAPLEFLCIMIGLSMVGVMKNRKKSS